MITAYRAYLNPCVSTRMTEFLDNSSELKSRYWFFDTEFGKYSLKYQ